VFVKRRELEKKLQKLGWKLDRHNEINEYTAKAILKEAKGGE